MLDTFNGTAGHGPQITPYFYLKYPNFPWKFFYLYLESSSTSRKGKNSNVAFVTDPVHNVRRDTSVTLRKFSSNTAGHGLPITETSGSSTVPLKSALPDFFFVKFLKQRKSCVTWGHHLSPSPFSFTSKLPGAPEGILEKISLFSSGLKITLSTSYNESYHLEFFSSSASVADRVLYFEHAQKSTGSNK